LHRLDKESTIYNFTLIRKVRHRPMPLLLYGILPLPIAIFLSVSVSPWTSLWMAGGIVLLPLLYSMLIGLHIKMLGADQRGTWSYAWRLPWLGLLPNQHFPLRTITRIHHQLFWIGLAIIGCLYPWIDKGHWLILSALHLWYLAPRYWILYLLRRTKKQGVLKINAGDTSYYVQ
jgi:hypothetical protein